MEKVCQNRMDEQTITNRYTSPVSLRKYLASCSPPASPRQCARYCSVLCTRYFTRGKAYRGVPSMGYLTDSSWISARQEKRTRKRRENREIRTQVGTARPLYRPRPLAGHSALCPWSPRTPPVSQILNHPPLLRTLPTAVCLFLL